MSEYIKPNEVNMLVISFAMNLMLIIHLSHLFNVLAYIKLYLFSSPRRPPPIANNKIPKKNDFIIFNYTVQYKYVYRHYK